MNYEHFLLFIGAMFCPLFGVVLADYFLMRKGSLAVEDLYRREGRYWFTQGVNLRAILAWAIGFVVYLGFSPMLMEQGPRHEHRLSMPDRLFATQFRSRRGRLLGARAKEGKIVPHATVSSLPHIFKIGTLRSRHVPRPVLAGRIQPLRIRSCEAPPYRRGRDARLRVNLNF